MEIDIRVLLDADPYIDGGSGAGWYFNTNNLQVLAILVGMIDIEQLSQFPFCP